MSAVNPEDLVVLGDGPEPVPPPVFVDPEVSVYATRTGSRERAQSWRQREHLDQF
jgi:hypothetical protein